LRRGEQCRTDRLDLREVFAEVRLRVEALLMVTPRTAPATAAFGAVLVGTIIELQRISLRWKSRASYAK
jgi:hypothetical protein